MPPRVGSENNLTCDDATPMESLRPYHSMWMDRWMTTSCNSTSQVHTQFSPHDEGKAKGYDLEQGRTFQISELSNRIDVNTVSCETSQYINPWRCQREDTVVASNVPQSVHAVEAKRGEITCEALTTNSRNLGYSKFELNPVSISDSSERLGFDLAHKRLAVSIESDNTAKHVITMAPSNLPFLCRSDPSEAAFHLNEYLSRPEGRLESQMLSVDKKNISTSRLLQNKLTGSNFNFVPQGLKSRELQSWLSRKEEAKRSSCQVASKEQFKSTDSKGDYGHNYDRLSSVMILDKQMNNYHAGSRDSGKSYSGKNNGAMQLNDPSSSNMCFPMSYRELSTKRHEDISIGLGPIHSCPGQLRLEEFNNESHVSSDVPQPVHHSDKLRLLGSLNFVEGVSRGPKFSQTVNNLSITDLSKGKKIFKGSAIPSDLKGSAPLKSFTLLPGFDCRDEHSEKLRPLGSPRNSEEKEHLGNESTSFLAKNESSAETDTMDVNVCPTWNSLPSITSSPSSKDTIVRLNKVISHSTLREKVGSRKRKIELPDFNHEPLSYFVAEKALSNNDLSISRTESLDLEHLHVDQAGNSNSSSQQCLTSSMDPSCRWIKRLRLSSSEYSAHGTKNVKLGEFSSITEGKRLCNKNNVYKSSTLRPTFGKLSGEKVGLTEQNRTLLSLGNKEHTSMDSTKEYGGINLSHPWIQRWCHNQVQTSKMKSASPVPCELDGSKLALDEYQTKHFPSIAAMALMGKTMKGLQACKFQNKGSFVVWNTERF